MKISSILGLNARAQQFAYRYNSRRGKNIADSKIQTAGVLRRAGVPHPKIFKKFKYVREKHIMFRISTISDKFRERNSS